MSEEDHGTMPDVPSQLEINNGPREVEFDPQAAAHTMRNEWNQRGGTPMLPRNPPRSGTGTQEAMTVQTNYLAQRSELLAKVQGRLRTDLSSAPDAETALMERIDVLERAAETNRAKVVRLAAIIDDLMRFVKVEM